MSPLQIRNSLFKQQNFEIIIFFLGFLSVQRNLLSQIQHLVFVIPGLIALYLFLKNSRLFLTIYILTILFTVDNGGEIYKISPLFIRLPLYVLGFLALIRQKSLYSNKNLLLFWIITIVNGIFILIKKNEPSHTFTTVRDFIVFGAIFLLILKQKNNNLNTLRMQTLHYGIMGYLIGEFLNVLLFGWGEDFNYINYHSMKSLILFPTFYIIYLRRLRQLVWIIPITLIVIAYYGTRMIFLIYICILLLYFFKWITQSFRWKNLIIITVSSLFILTSFNWRYLEKYKTTYTIIQIIDNINSSENILKIIDPVRFGEHKLFFDRSLNEILLGSGLGSGLYDKEDYFKFIRISNNTGAFTAKEITEGRFYNLHDTWIDLGLRLGIVWIILIYIFLIKKIAGKNDEMRVISASALVLFSCSAFSFFGIISTALFLNLNQNNKI